MTDCPDYSDLIDAALKSGNLTHERISVLLKLSWTEGYTACQRDNNKRMGIENETQK